MICALFFILAMLYAGATPYRQGGTLLMQGRTAAADIGAPDERQHVNYIAFVRSQGALPVLKPDSPDFYESYQAHQPPLYYVLMAPLFNPSAPIESTGSVLRFPSALIGVLTVLGLFWLGCLATGEPKWGLACAAMALLPGFVTLHGAVTNDPLLFCFVTWSLAFLVRALVSEGVDGRAWWLAGVLAGLACLTKSSGLILLPVLIGSAAWFLLRRREGVRALAGASIAALVLPLPIWIRNQQLYGDPLGLKVFESAFQGSAKASMFTEALGPFVYWTEWVAWWTVRSGVGAFGYMDIFLPDGVYRIALAGLFVCALGWLVAARRGEASPVPRVAWGVLGAYGVLVLLSFMRFNSTFFQAQARYLFPAIAVFGLIFGMGAVRWGRWALPTLIAALVALNGFAVSVLPAEFERRIQTPPRVAEPAP